MRRKKAVDKRKLANGDNYPRNEDGLTPKESLFVGHYLEHFIASKSARLAGYKDKKNNTSELGWRLLRNNRIRDVIDRKIKERETRLEYSADDVLKEYIRIAFFDPACLYDENNDFVGIENLNPQQRAMIKTIRKKQTRWGEELIIEVHDKMEALNKMTLHFGIMLPKIKVDGKMDYNLKLETTVEELKNLGTDRVSEIIKLLSQPKSN